MTVTKIVTARLLVHRDDGHGHPAYDPKTLLGVLPYAYCIAARSSRQIERVAPRDLLKLPVVQRAGKPNCCLTEQHSSRALLMVLTVPGTPCSPSKCRSGTCSTSPPKDDQPTGTSS